MKPSGFQFEQIAARANALRAGALDLLGLVLLISLPREAAMEPAR